MIGKQIEDLYKTINQVDPTDIYRALPNNRGIYILCKCTCYIFQGRPCVKPQITCQETLKDRDHAKLSSPTTTG